MTTFAAPPGRELSDAEVIADAVRDPLAFVGVFDRHYPTVHRYLARRAGAQVADDLASETFTRALAQVSLFDSTAASARPWLLGIATNLLHRHHRDEARFLRALARSGAAAAVDHAEDMADAADLRMSAQRWSRPLAKALLGLPAPDRDALLLLAWEGLTYAEIATTLGIRSGPSAPGCIAAAAGFAPHYTCSTPASSTRSPTMSEPRMTDLTVLARLRPAAAAADPAVATRARQALVERATAANAHRGAPLRRRLLARPAGTIAIVATVTFAAVAAQTTAGPLIARAQAAVALRQAARSASRSAAVTARADQFLYTRTEAIWSVGTTLHDGTSITWLQPGLYQAWISVDGTRNGVIRHTDTGAPIFLHPGDRAAVLADGQHPRAAGYSDSTVLPAGEGPGADLNDPSYAYLRSLPTNPVELFLLIAQHSVGHGQSLPQEMLTTVSDMLSFSVAPPALRAALFEVAAAIPGVSWESGGTDYAGRHGTTVALTTNGVRQELIFDPSTARLLGTREVATVTEDGVPAGTVMDNASTTVTVVDNPPSNP